METTTNKESYARLCCQLWTGILGAPSVWLIQLQTNYALVPWVCAHGQRQFIVFSFLLFLFLAITSGVFALRGWRTQQKNRIDLIESGQFEIANFMGQLGFLISSLFTLLIIFQAIPLFIVDPCFE
jgi:hypothetical protein